tara:strand:+ start:35755 stop:37557 length:1803 start_codon:yes stop_codon:yes gene_type:complete
MTIRKFSFEIEGLFKAAGEIDINDSITPPVTKPEPPVSKPVPPIGTIPPVIPDGSRDITEFGVSSINSQLEGLMFRGNWYPGMPKPAEDGYWIGYTEYPVIIKVKGGVKTVEKAKSWIGTPEWNALDLSAVNLYIPSGIYLLLQGPGMNPLWYQKTKSISGSGTLIAVNSDRAQRYNNISSLGISGVKLVNIRTDNTPAISQNQFYNGAGVALIDQLEKSRNAITCESIDASITAYDAAIDANAVLRAGFYIDRAKSVDINGGYVKALSADNGIRIGRVLTSCKVKGFTTGKNFNTGIQASSNREAVSEGFDFSNNLIEGVLEEGLGFDSYANNLYQIPVIGVAEVVSSSGKSVTLGQLYFIEEVVVGKQYRKKEVSPGFIGTATNYKLVVQDEYRVADIISYSVEGNSLTLNLSDSVQVGRKVSIVSGFYKCKLHDNEIKGVKPASGQPGHGLSLWGGGFFNTVKNNRVTGSRNGLQLASIGGFGLDEFFCHSIGNIVEGNFFIGCDTAFLITSENSHRLSSDQSFISNTCEEGGFLIKNQRNLTLAGNVFKGNTGLIENVSGVFEGGQLIDTVITVKNSPNLSIGQIDLIGNSDIKRV